METISELGSVVLEHDLPEHGLALGDVGTVVHRCGDGKALEVAFVAGEGETGAVATLEAEPVCLMQQREILPRARGGCVTVVSAGVNHPPAFSRSLEIGAYAA